MRVLFLILSIVMLWNASGFSDGSELREEIRDRVEGDKYHLEMTKQNVLDHAKDTELLFEIWEALEEQNNTLFNTLLNNIDKLFALQNAFPQYTNDPSQAASGIYMSKIFTDIAIKAGLTELTQRDLATLLGIIENRYANMFIPSGAWKIVANIERVVFEKITDQESEFYGLKRIRLETVDGKKIKVDFSELTNDGKGHPHAEAIELSDNATFIFQDRDVEYIDSKGRIKISRIKDRLLEVVKEADYTDKDDLRKMKQEIRKRMSKEMVEIMSDEELDIIGRYSSLVLYVAESNYLVNDEEENNILRPFVDFIASMDSRDQQDYLDAIKYGLGKVSKLTTRLTSRLKKVKSSGNSHDELMKHFYILFDHAMATVDRRAIWSLGYSWDEKEQTINHVKSGKRHEDYPSIYFETRGVRAISLVNATFPKGVIISGQENVNTSPTNSLFMVIEAAFLTFNPAL